MKQILIVTSLSLLWLSSFTVNAQTVNEATVFSDILDITEWTKKLNSSFKSLSKQERKDKCIRILGYVGSDLDLLATQKQLFCSELKAKDVDQVSNSKKLSDMTATTMSLMNNIRDLNAMVNDNLGEEGNLVLEKLSHETLYQKTKYHDAMMNNTQKEQLRQLELDCIKSSKLLVEASQSIWSLRGKLVKE